MSFLVIFQQNRLFVIEIELGPFFKSVFISFSQEDKNSRNSIKGGFFCWLQIYVFRLEDLSISDFEQKTHFWGSWKFFSFRKILILKNSAQEWALERQGFGLSYLISLFCFIRAATVSRKLSNWIPHNSISLNFYHFSSSWKNMLFT